MTHWSIRANGDNGMTELSHQGQVDEIVIGSWFHLEQMDRLHFWMRVGDANITVDLRPSSRPVVDIDRGAQGEMRGTTTVGAPAVAPKTLTPVEEVYSFQAAISRLRAQASSQRVCILPDRGLTDVGSFFAALSHALTSSTEPAATDWTSMRSRLAAALASFRGTMLVVIWPSAFELFSRDAEAYRFAREMFEQAGAAAGEDGLRVLICTGRDDGL